MIFPRETLYAGGWLAQEQNEKILLVHAAEQRKGGAVEKGKNVFAETRVHCVPVVLLVVIYGKVFPASFPRVASQVQCVSLCPRQLGSLCSAQQACLSHARPGPGSRQEHV